METQRHCRAVQGMLSPYIDPLAVARPVLGPIKIHVHVPQPNVVNPPSILQAHPFLSL